MAETNVEVARARWGEAAPEWIVSMAESCDQKSQSAIARVLGVSGTMINQALRNIYTGRLDRLEQKVRGELMREKVACPVLGEITKRKCIDAQSQPYSAVNELRVELLRACPSCPNRHEKTA